MAKEQFADRLKLAMEHKGLKQVDVIRAAAEQGVKLGKSHMSQYVSGKTVPRTDILHFLAQTMEVKVAWLSGEEPSPIEKENAGGNEMRIFKKSSKLDNVLYDVRGPVVDEAERMTAAGTQVLKLNIGKSGSVWISHTR